MLLNDYWVKEIKKIIEINKNQTQHTKTIYQNRWDTAKKQNKQQKNVNMKVYSSKCLHQKGKKGGCGGSRL